MNILKRLQEVIKGFNKSTSNLVQETIQVEGITIESIDANDISKYEQLTEVDKKRVDMYIKELNGEWTSNLKENPLSKLIVFENEETEKSQELLNLILLIIQRIDTSSQDVRFTDGKRNNQR